jgi:hypothetical protein
LSSLVFLSTSNKLCPVVGSVAKVRSKGPGDRGVYFEVERNSSLNYSASGEFQALRDVFAKTTTCTYKYFRWIAAALERRPVTFLFLPPSSLIICTFLLTCIGRERSSYLQLSIHVYSMLPLWHGTLFPQVWISYQWNHLCAHLSRF